MGKRKTAPLSSTLAILDAQTKTPESKVTIPTEEGVKDAKDWVDSVEK